MTCRLAALLCASLAGACAGEAASSEPDDLGPEATIRDFVEEPDRICRVVRACYPDQPDDPTFCQAPADEDRSASWLTPDKDRLQRCLDTIDDREGLARWLRCITDAETQTARCLESCPPSAEACAVAGNERSATCEEGQDFPNTIGLCLRGEEP